MPSVRRYSWRRLEFRLAPLPGPDAAQYGAFHTAEVPYVLNTLCMSDRPFTEADTGIANMASSYWVSFATRGDPNGKGLPHWPSAREMPRGVMRLGAVPEPIPAAGSDAQFELWRARAAAVGR